MLWILLLLVSSCGGSPLHNLEAAIAMHGEVRSPLYPLPYPPNLQQQWELLVPEGYQIRLTFTHLDIEASASCFYDALTVLEQNKVLGRFCGQENSADGHHPGQQPIISTGNSLTLVFQTDSSNPELHQNVGFLAHYQAIDRDECSEPDPVDGSGRLCSQICLNTLGSYLCSCYHGYVLRSDQRTCDLSCSGGIFDEPEGHLTSPGFPHSPTHGLSCQYIIAVEAGFTVSLNFSDVFHIESVDTDQGPLCLHHWLQVSVPDKEPVKLCGGESPGWIPTDSNIVTLDYHVDDQGVSNGWSLDYTTHRVQCPSPGSVSRGRVTPAMPEYLYRDQIYVRCDPGYKLMMNGEEIQSFSAMCQNNGQWHLPLPTCQIIDCGEPALVRNGRLTFLEGSQNQYLSVVQYGCNEPFYVPIGGDKVNLTCEADRKWRTNHIGYDVPKCIPVCGLAKPISTFKRIIGGAQAPDDTIPWQVLLIFGGPFSGRGGGIIIDERWLLTAAHNVYQEGQHTSPSNVKIYVGSTDVRTLLASRSHTVASIHVHPAYGNFNNDVALIKLEEPLTFHSSVMPICLPLPGATYMDGVMGLVSGFGVTNSQDTNIRILTNKLKYLSIPVVDQDTCAAAMATQKGDMPTLSDNMFCAGMPEGHGDSCQGDSGSAFALKEGGRFSVAGIVSWGVGCGKIGTYGIYTRVANYVDWIRTTMEANDDAMSAPDA